MIEDVFAVCVHTVPSTDTESDRLMVFARLESDGCESDHRGAYLRCSIEREGDGVLRIRSTFRDGEDPNDGCADPLEAICTLEVAPGERTLRYGDEVVDVTLPILDPLCFDAYP